MLLNSLANILLGLLDSFPVAEAARQGRAVGEIPDILCFFFDDDFEGVVGHLSGSFALEVYHKRHLDPITRIALMISFGPRTASHPKHTPLRFSVSSFPTSRICVSPS